MKVISICTVPHQRRFHTINGFKVVQLHRHHRAVSRVRWWKVGGEVDVVYHSVRGFYCASDVFRSIKMVRSDNNFWQFAQRGTVPVKFNKTQKLCIIQQKHVIKNWRKLITYCICEFTISLRLIPFILRCCSVFVKLTNCEKGVPAPLPPLQILPLASPCSFAVLEIDGDKRHEK